MNSLCSAAGCSVPATTRAAYCARHNGRRARHGHYTGRGLTRDLIPFYRRTTLLLHPLRQSHEGVKTACDDLDSLLKRWAAGEREGQPLRSFERELARLTGHGIDGLDILEAACAVLLFDAESPYQLRDQRALRFAIARFVAALAPLQGARLGARVAIPIGDFLLARYGAFLLVVRRRFEEEKAQDARREKLLSTPIAL